MAKFITLFIVAALINLNNILQMIFLAGKNLIDLYAIWESSSIIFLCIYFLILCSYTMIGKDCIGEYMNRKQIILFYLNICIKFLSAILSIIYIIWLYPTEYKKICYFLQFIIIFCDIIMSFYIIKYISKIVHSKKETLIRYNKKHKLIVCTEEEKNKVEDLYAIGCLLIIANFFYNFILSFPDYAKISLFIFIMSIIIIFVFVEHIKKVNYLIQEYKKKNSIRGIGYLAISNITNICICFFSIDYMAKIYFLFIFDFIVGVLVYIQMLKSIEKSMFGMISYLEKENKSNNL